MPLFLSHVAVKIRGLCSVYIVYGAKGETDNRKAMIMGSFNNFSTLSENRMFIFCFFINLLQNSTLTLHSCF